MKTNTATLIWVDAEQAIICRWDGHAATIETIASEVPAHRRSTGHVRHTPTVRHGGGGAAQDAGEPRRLEHLRAFLAGVAGRAAPQDALEVIGPGTVHERLAALIVAEDREAGRGRPIVWAKAGPLTERQLAARVRESAGVNVPRRGLRSG